MRLIQGSMVVCVLLALGACHPTENAPEQTIMPVGTTSESPAASKANLVTPYPVPIEAFSSTPTSPAIRLTETNSDVQAVATSLPPALTITIIYDNNVYDQRLSSAWGFSALVEYQDHTLLFDTGDDGQLLMENMRILGIDPTRIDSVVLSHAHDDHTGGLTALLNSGVEPTVYLLPSFPSAFKRQIERFTQINEVFPGQSFAEGLWTTGETGTAIPEQALVIQTVQGLVIITGCAHPGIVSILEQAAAMFTDPIRLVLGGFHLGSKSEAEINTILADFRRLEVQRVAPCHCTGENSIAMFAAEYGTDFIQIGAGSIIRLEAGDR